MRVQITARHCEVSDAVRERASELMDKLARFDPRITGAELVFHEEKHSKKVEGIVTRERREPLVASGDAPEWLPALDVVFDRLSRRVRKARSQAVDHQAGPPVRETVGD